MRTGSQRSAGQTLDHFGDRYVVAVTRPAVLDLDQPVAPAGDGTVDTTSAEPPADAAGVGICDANPALSGPVEPPPGAITVEPGVDAVALVAASPPSATFWFAKTIRSAIARW